MRKKIFEIIELADENNKLSRVYDVFMMITIFISLIPLAFKQ
jgi:voltage-gated potassium channel